MSVLTAAPAVSLDIHGDDSHSFKRDLSTFTEDLRNLLGRAGCVGRYKVYQRGACKGSCHKKGITIGRPEMNAVEIRAQYGDNGSRQSWVLYTQKHESSEKLRQRLLDALDTPHAEQERVVKTPEAINDDEHIEESPPESTRHAPPASEVRGSEEAKPSRLNIVSDPENQALFISEVADQADAQGIVAKRSIIDILKEHFGFASGKGAGPVIAATQKRGLLALVGTEYVKLTPQAYSLLGKEAPVTAGTSRAGTVLPPPEQAPTTPAVPIDTGASPYLGKIAELEREASGGADLQEEADELERELAGHRDQQRSLEQQLESIRSQVQNQEQQLADVRFRLNSTHDAKERLSEIRRLLEL